MIFYAVLSLLLAVSPAGRLPPYHPYFCRLSGAGRHLWDADAGHRLRPLWSGLFSAIAFGGSTQYAAVPLLAAGFDPLEVFLLSLTISARHLFYSVSMLKKYDDLGWKRWMLYYTLCDETFSVVSTVEPPEGVDAGKFYLSVSLLDWSYWVTASMLGGVLGGVLPFDISGMDFALTALFVVLFLEQLRQKQRRLPGAIGIACAVVALLVCGPDNLVIPSMVLIFASLLIGRKKLCA